MNKILYLISFSATSLREKMSDDRDIKDIEILKMLRIDSRTPMGVIGDAMNISKATVSRRIAKMENDGIITNYSLSLDANKIGLMKSMVMLQIISNPVSVVIEQLKPIKEIRNIYKSFGDHHLVCEIYTKSVDELYELIQTKLLKMPSVRNVEVDILVEKIPHNINADLEIYSEMNDLL